MTIVLTALKLLLNKPFYLFLSILLGVFLFILYIVLNSFPVFASIATISLDPYLLLKVFANQVILIWNIAGPINILAVAAISILAGLNISLTILRTKATKVFIGRPNLLTLFGSFGGAFGATCSACNTSLVALLGVSGGLAVFPLRGLEFSMLSLVLLILSLYYVSKSMMEIGIIKYTSLS